MHAFLLPLEQRLRHHRELLIVHVPLTSKFDIEDDLLAEKLRPNGIPCGMVNRGRRRGSRYCSAKR